jgi:hypothetical protein
MNPAMMNPEMMKAAQDMMAKMSPEDMQKSKRGGRDAEPPCCFFAYRIVLMPHFPCVCAQ